MATDLLEPGTHRCCSKLQGSRLSTAQRGFPKLPSTCHHQLAHKGKFAQQQSGVLLHQCSRWSASASMSASKTPISAAQQNGPDISRLRSDLQREWDHDSNWHITGVVRPHSQKKVSWICPNCPDGHLHRWVAQICNRTPNTDCPFCSGRKVCSHNSLAKQAPATAKEWDTDKNPDSPHDYTSRSKHPAHWKCQHGHQWQARIFDRVRRMSGCPVCAVANRSKQPAVASNPRAMQLWDKEQNAEHGLDPSLLTCGSNKFVHCICDKCPMQQPHRWQARIRYIARRKQGCPFCAHTRVCRCNSLATKRPDLAAEWCSTMNEGTPDDYTSRSSAEVWWQNERRGIWKGSIAARSCQTRGPLHDRM